MVLPAPQQPFMLELGPQQPGWWAEAEGCLWGGQAPMDERGAPEEVRGPTRPLRCRKATRAPSAVHTHPGDCSTPRPHCSMPGPSCSPRPLRLRAARCPRSAGLPEPPARSGVSAFTAQRDCAPGTLPQTLGRRRLLARRLAAPRHPATARRRPSPPASPRLGGCAPARRPGAPHSPARTRPPRRSPREGFLPHLDPARLPSASLPLPAAPLLPRGRRPGWAAACADQEGWARPGAWSRAGSAPQSAGRGRGLGYAVRASAWGAERPDSHFAASAGCKLGATRGPFTALETRLDAHWQR